MKFVLGFAIGVGLGLLFAPAPGEETRNRLAEDVRAWARMPRAKIRQAAEAGKQRAAELGSRVGRQTAEAAVEAVEQSLLGDEKTA